MRRLPTILALALALLGLLASDAQAAAAPHAKTHGKKHKAAPPTLALTPSLTAAPGVTVSMPPVGVSLEYPLMAADLGQGECPPPAMTAELERLGSPPLQIGGQSQDFTVPAASAPASPQNWEELALYRLPASFWTTLHCLLGAAHDPLTAGLNLRIGTLRWAEQMVAGASAAASNGLAFSLGNEPDLYYLPNYYSLGKPLAGEEAAEVGTYLRAVEAIRPALGSAPLVGPEMSVPAHWQSELPGLISTLGIKTLGIHAYPLSVCRTPRAATVNGLLEPSVGSEPARLAWVVADARAAGAQPVITEANSVSCGGKAGVSDTPAAAVWALRFVISALETGFAEVRIHFSGDPYDPFYLRSGEVVRRPIEGAMVALNQWLPVGATLRSISRLHGFTVTAIAAPGAQPLALIDNPARKAAALVLRGAAGAQTQFFSASGAPPSLHALPGGSERVMLPANTVLAVRY